MPIKHAALKQIRKDGKRRQRNQAVRAQLKTLTKQFLTLVNGQQLDEARLMIPRVEQRYDRAAAKGVIHRNTAARLKSRLMRRLVQRPPQAP